MFRLCWEKYIIDKKFNGYYLWERYLPFQYREVLSGVDSLTNYFVKDDLNNIAEHVMSKMQAKALIMKNDYDSDYKTHIKLSMRSAKKEGADFDYGSFNDFITEFTKQQLAGGWEQKIDFPESYFAYGANSKIHASNYYFNNVYMIMKDVDAFRQTEEFIEKNKLVSDNKSIKINKWS